MSETATTASAPTAPSAPASAPSSSSGSSSSGSSSGAMSTADFRKSVLGKPTPKPAQTVQPEPVELQSTSDDIDDSSAYGDNNVSDEFSQESVEEQVSQADDSADDWSWAESFKDYRDGVHGVATAELLQALAQGQIPEALMDKLSLTMQDGDEEWTGTVADLKNGAQMHANFTKKSQALANEKKEFYSDRGELVDYFRSWREDESGEKGLLGLEKMLGPDAVYKIASKLAQRLDRKAQLEAAEQAGHIPPGTAAIIMEREALVREVEETKRYKARQEAEAEKQQVNTQAVSTGQKIQNEAVNQFKLAGITTADGTLTTGMWNLFKEELGALWTTDKTPGPTEIRTAVMAAKQRSERIVRQHQTEAAAAAAKKAGRPPAIQGASPAGAPAAPKRVQGNAKKAMSTAEFKAKVMNNGRPFSGR